MKKNLKSIGFVIASVLILLSLVLSACGPIDNGNDHSNKGNGNGQDIGNDNENENGNNNDKVVNSDKITICHKTGSAQNPYVEIIVANDAVNDGHGTHVGDIIPASENGCPTE